ncbi:MAG: MFS transporter [Bacteroidota bacterium]
MENINKNRLFYASCVALIVTAMTFAIRAGILTELSGDFALDDIQLGWVNSMAFLGFPIAMMIGGLLYNEVGPKRMMWVAFISHLLGLVLTITAGGFWGLMISTFFIGFANGAVEAACNPLIADMYPDNKTTMLNKFHVWFPGGIVIGSLVSGGMESLQMGWQMQIAIMLIPTAIYAFLIFGQEFPKSLNIVSNTRKNISAIFNPLFLFIAACMTLTAATEFSTTQWVEKILGASGAQPMLVLALVTGLMAVGRYFAGPLVHRLNPAGVLLGSAIISALGIFMLSQVTGPMIYLAAILFAVGICYFWPTMIGFTGEYLPETGALGMSLIGGAGMFSMTIWNPVIGGWLQGAREEALATGVSGPEAELIAGQATLSILTLIPCVLIVLFGCLYFYMKNRINDSSADPQYVENQILDTPLD